jgi:TPR repeat protein
MKPNADPRDDANKAFESGDYDTARKIMQPLAEQGDAEVQKSLGDMYFYGQGVAQDHAEAVKWFRKAAGQGDASAQNRLGDRYFFGQGVALDYAEAVKWFRKAAEQGDAEAQYKLGAMYASARRGMQDHIQAHMWYDIAAARSSDMGNRAGSVQARNTVAKLMTPAQRAEARKLAREWKPKPAGI